MKKLLALLGSMSIVASSVTVVGFEYANLVKSSIEAKIRNYVNISSLLARATVLSQKSTDDKNQPTDGKDFSLHYSSKYLYGKKMSNFFTNSEFKDDGQSKIRSYFSSMFNLPPSSSLVYTLKNEDFLIASPTLSLQDDEMVGKSGEDSTLNILNYVSAFGPVLFGRDFSASTSANFLEKVLSAGQSPIRDLMENGTFKTIQTFLFDKNDNKSLFTKISESLNEDDLKDLKDQDNNPIALEDATFDDVFKFRQIKFWQGLAEILYSGTRAEDTPEQLKEWMDNIAAASDGKYAEQAIPGSGEKSDINVQFNQILVDGIVRILPYLRTLFNYIQSFSETALPLEEITDYNHLFDPNVINGMFVANQLRKNYLNLDHVIDETHPTTEVVQWVKDPNNNYHQVLNLQDLIQFIQQLLSVDLKNDPDGYRNARILAILFELPLKDAAPVSESRDTTVSTPVFDLILEPLVKQLVTKLIPNFGGVIATLIPQITPVIRAVLTHNQSLWENVAGANDNLSNFILVLELIKPFANLIPIGQNLKEVIGEWIDQIKAEQTGVENGEIPIEDQIYGQPFKTLFNGEFIPKIIQILLDYENPIDAKIQKVLKNLATLLTTNLGDVLASFGLDISTLPIFLYGIKDLSLTEIINSFAAEFKVNLDKILAQNQDFLFNLDALDRVAQSLTTNVKIEFLGETPQPVVDAGITDLDHVNILNAILIAFGYTNEIKDLTLDYSGTVENWNHENQKISKYGFLLGTRQIEGQSAYEFQKGSVFSALSQIYGHDNALEPEDFQPKNAATVRQILEGVAKLVNWFNNNSIPAYIKDTFDPYFDSQHWKTELKSSRNVDRADEIATITYFLYYQNPDTGQTHQYEVKMSRAAYDGSAEDWNNLGTWQVVSLNLKK